MSNRLLLTFALLLLPVEACTNADISFPDGGFQDARTLIDAGPPRAGAGDLVITELLVDPNGTDSAAEYVELHNPSATLEYELAGCVIEDHNGPAHPIDPASGSLTIAPGAYLTLATFTMDSEGGFTPDYSYGSSILLTNTGASVTLSCDGVTVDVVDYRLAGFTVLTGASFSLDPGSIDALANDDSANYCPGTGTYGPVSNLGSPGAENPACP